MCEPPGRRVQHAAPLATPRDRQRVAGPRTGHEQQAVLGQQVRLVLHGIHFGRRHLRGERKHAGRHSHNGHAAELQPLHRVHGGHSYPGHVRSRIVLDRDRRNALPPQAGDHRVNQSVEPGAHRHLGRLDTVLVDPGPDLLDQRPQLLVLAGVSECSRNAAVQLGTVAPERVPSTVIVVVLTESAHGLTVEEGRGPTQNLLRAAVVEPQPGRASPDVDTQ